MVKLPSGRSKNARKHIHPAIGIALLQALPSSYWLSKQNQNKTSIKMYHYVWFTGKSCTLPCFYNSNMFDNPVEKWEQWEVTCYNLKVCGYLFEFVLTKVYSNHIGYVFKHLKWMLSHQRNYSPKTLLFVQES